MTEQAQNLTGARVHPPILTGIYLLVAFALGWLAPLPIPAPGWVSLAGWLIAGLGLALAFWAVSRFRQAQTTLDPQGGTTAIVTDGPYHFSRNPIYIGYVLLLVGFPLTINIYWGLILAPALIVLMNRLVIEYEEAYLEKHFKQEYLDYKSKVRRWL
jgi:protein-S-isoprenylcysteine O-methyltransferase Ste14